MTRLLRVSFVIILLGSLVAVSAFVHQGTESVFMLRGGDIEPGSVVTMTTYLFSQPYDLGFALEQDFVGRVLVDDYATYVRFTETSIDSSLLNVTIRGSQTIGIYPPRRGAYVIHLESSGLNTSSFGVTLLQRRSLHSDVFLDGAVISALGAGSLAVLYPVVKFVIERKNPRRIARPGRQRPGARNPQAGELRTKTRERDRKLD